MAGLIGYGSVCIKRLAQTGVSVNGDIYGGVEPVREYLVEHLWGFLGGGVHIDGYPLALGALRFRHRVQ